MYPILNQKCTLFPHLSYELFRIYRINLFHHINQIINGYKSSGSSDSSTLSSMRNKICIKFIFTIEQKNNNLQ